MGLGGGRQETAMKRIESSIDKEAVSAMPRELFGGEVVVVCDEAEAERAVSFLMSQTLLGFDTETRPSFKRGECHKVALLQVSTSEVCYLFRLSLLDMPPSVIRLLSEEGPVRVALSWHDDLHALHKRADFQCAPFVELQDYVRQLGVTDMSLQKLYANIFGKRIAKGCRLSNWEAPILTEAQKLYAATDAWACVKLYEEIGRLLRTGDYELHVVSEEPPHKNEEGNPQEG